jgi:hypothetical protein
VATVPLEVRTATADDLPAVARVRVASWRAGYAGLVPDSELAAIGEQDRLDHWVLRTATSAETSTLVALRDGEVIGFAA